MTTTADRPPENREQQIEALLQVLRNTEAALKDLGVDRDTSPLPTESQGYRTLFEDNPQPMFVYDFETLHFLAVNDSAIAQYGYSRSEFLSMRIMDIRPEQDIPVMMELIHAIADGNERASSSSIRRHQLKSGSVINVEIWSRFIEFNGRRARVVTAQNVTPRVETDAALKAAQQRNQMILESVGEGIHGLDSEGQISFENAAALKMLGWTAKEMLGKPAHDLIHHHRADGSPYPASECPIYKTLRDGVTRRVDDDTFYRRDGSAFPVEYACSPVKDSSGIISGAVVCFRDVSIKKATEAALRERESLLSSAQRIGRMGSWITDFKQKRVFWPPETCQLFGIEPSDFDGNIDSFDQYVLPDDRASIANVRENEGSEGSHFEVEFRIRRKDGVIRWMYGRGTTEYDDNGDAVRRLGVIVDRTERKRVELFQLLEARVLELVSLGKPLSEVFDLTVLGIEEMFPGAMGSILLLDADGLHLHHGSAPGLPEAYVQAIDGITIGPNVGSCGTACYRREPVIVADIESDPLWADYRTLALSHNLRACWSTPVLDGEGRVLATFAIYYSERRLPDSQDVDLTGSVARIISIAIDFKHKQELLRSSEERFRRTFLDAATGIAITNAVGRLLEANAACTRMLGYSSEEFREIYLPSLVHPDEFIIIDEAVAGLRSGETGRTLETRFLRKNGTAIWTRVTLSMLRSVQGEPEQIIYVIDDVTQRKQAQERLSEQAMLLDEAHDAIIVTGLDGRITYWSKGAERCYGWLKDQALDNRIDELIYENPTSARSAIDKTISAGEWSGESDHISRSGAKIVVESRYSLVRNENGSPKAILSINTDISERRRLEQQFLRAQRLESIGTLAGGIAHDLNNALTPVMMAVELLLDSEADPERRQLLSNIETGAARGAAMVRQVLSFARGIEGRHIRVDISLVCRDIRNIIKDTFPKNIVLDPPDETADIWQVRGDPTQLHQALVNLCLNARDAMPEGGTLALKLRNQELEAGQVASNPPSGMGAYVAIQVSDTGTGIPRDIVDHIFDPFFTTKEPGKGTGLGLSTTQAIIRGHNGYITIESDDNEGTTFVIYLPADLSQRNEVKQNVMRPQLPVGNGELILVVDDEEFIRDLVRHNLERNGYQTILAANGAEAVALYQQNRGRIAAVLTDMMMPIMDGPSTIRALRAIDADVCIVACSGVGSSMTSEHKGDAELSHFIPKPYTAERLLRVLHAALTANN